MITSFQEHWTQTLRERREKKDPSVVAPELMRYLDATRWPGTMQPLPKSLADAVRRKARSNIFRDTLASLVNSKNRELHDHVQARPFCNVPRACAADTMYSCCRWTSHVREVSLAVLLHMCRAHSLLRAGISQSLPCLPK